MRRGGSLSRSDSALVAAFVADSSHGKDKATPAPFSNVLLAISFGMGQLQRGRPQPESISVSL
jgi:hypothetical protein